MKNIAVTGATGMVGAQLLRSLASRPKLEAIHLLLGGPSEDERSAAVDRLRQFVGKSDEGKSIEFVTVSTNLAQSRFGLGIEEWEKLGNSIDAVFHCAQLQSLTVSPEDFRQANVAPLMNWLQFLGDNQNVRFHHLSTAFVGGTHKGLFTEFDLECEQKFHNDYEKSKYEAECRLQNSSVRDRITIYRPSHSVGHSQTGEAFAFDGLYPLLQTLYFRGKSSVIPGDPLARLDVVPVDFVAEAMVTLAADSTTAGKTFHLTAGWPRSITVADFIQLVAGVGRHKTIKPRMVPHLLSKIAWLGGLISFGMASPVGREFARYRQYLRQGCVFDSFLAKSVLDAKKVSCPPPQEYLTRCVRFALDQSWQDGLEQQAKELMLGAHATDIATAVTGTHAGPKNFPQKRLFHQVGDYRVAYREVGEGEPIVFLSGFAGSRAWEGVAERLQRKYRCVLVETLGLGASEAPLHSDFSLPAQAAMVRGLGSALALESFYLVGNDTGGAIAQLLAVRWPFLVRKLVLSNSDAFDNWPPPQVALLQMAMRVPGGVEIVSAIMKLTFVARSRLGFGKLVYNKKIQTKERIAAYLEPLSDRACRQRLRRTLLSLDPSCTIEIAPLLQQLDVPTMIIWGCEDEYWSTSWAKKLYDEIRGAERLELIPFSGLVCQEESPDHFAGLLESFFEKVTEISWPEGELLGELSQDPHNSRENSHEVWTT